MRANAPPADAARASGDPDQVDHRAWHVGMAGLVLVNSARVPSMQPASRLFLSYTQSTTAKPSRSRAECCPRCIPSGTPSRPAPSWRDRGASGVGPRGRRCPSRFDAAVTGCRPNTPARFGSLCNGIEWLSSGLACGCRARRGPCRTCRRSGSRFGRRRSPRWRGCRRRRAGRRGGRGPGRAGRT